MSAIVATQKTWSFCDGGADHLPVQTTTKQRTGPVIVAMSDSWAASGPRRPFCSAVASLVLAAALLVGGMEGAGAEIVDPCVVRAESTIDARNDPVQLGVDGEGRLYQMTDETVGDRSIVMSSFVVRRYTASGALDAGYGPVRIEADASRPSMVVAGDGTVTISSFENREYTTLRFQRIDPLGRLSTIRSFGRAEHYVNSVGVMDVGERLLAGISLSYEGVNNVVVVVDVDTGEVVTDRSVGLVGPVTAISQRAFALTDGSVSIDGGIAARLTSPSANQKFFITDLLDTGDAVVAVGTVAPDTSLISPVRPVFVRIGSSGLPSVVTMRDETQTVAAIADNGIAVLVDREDTPWLAGNPPPPGDMELVSVDLATGEDSVAARLDGEVTFGPGMVSALATGVDGSMRVVNQSGAGPVFVFDLWAQPPSPPQVGVLTGQVERLYRAYFDRSPEPSGMAYWRTQRAKGVQIIDISNAFATSPEFVSTYGSLDDTQFVDLVYRNVLDRSPDNVGRSYWVGQLRAGQSRGSVMTGFSESAEFVTATATAAPHTDSEGQIARLYRAYFDRDADSTGFCYWAGQIDGLGVDSVSGEFAQSVEFVDTYGQVGDDEFVALVYRNVLGRDPDDAGRAFWSRELSRGLSRGRVMTAFSESTEYLLKTDTLPFSN